jgi:hypothetical protein
MPIAAGAMSKNAEVPQWWFVPQAIVWIVTRNEDEAASTPDMASLDELQPLSPNQFLKTPPISKVDAPRELLRAWHEGTVIIFGAKNGQGEPIAVPTPKYKFEAGFVTRHARLWLEVRIEVGAGLVEFWTSLSVRTAHCQATWPAPSDKPAQTKVTDNDITNCVAAIRNDLKRRRKPHGRNDLVKMVAAKLGVPGQRVRSLWDERKLGEKGGVREAK